MMLDAVVGDAILAAPLMHALFVLHDHQHNAAGAAGGRLIIGPNATRAGHVLLWRRAECIKRGANNINSSIMNITASS